ncbi:CNNM domain-containing protein, partial [Enterococcus faecalis]|uniref:CNNM domain-containing protein n=1 Tax=Enterococcus faecalis TaxID=1351 RepID=UPI003D6A7351
SPKRIAMNKSEEVAQLTSGAVGFLGVIARPFVWLLWASTDLLSKITPMTFDDAHSKMRRDEMRYMLATQRVLANEV